MKTVARERRKTSEQLALESYLNTEQLMSLSRIENFGWSLKYVRRPLFLEPVAIVFHKEILAYAILDIDGTLNRSGDVNLRSA